MNIQVNDNRVLIKYIKPETVTSFGIVISKGLDKSHEAVVIKVGPGSKNKNGVIVPLEVKENDKILFNVDAGITVNLNGESLMVIKESDIFAVFDE